MTFGLNKVSIVTIAAFTGSLIACNPVLSAKQPPVASELEKFERPGVTIRKKRPVKKNAAKKPVVKKTTSQPQVKPAIEKVARPVEQPPGKETTTDGPKTDQLPDKPVSPPPTVESELNTFDKPEEKPALERSTTIGPLGDIVPEQPAGEIKTEEERVAREEVREIRPLPGGLNSVPVFNSNSPEIVMEEGVLLSTFPSWDGPAHLNYSFDGRFDIFAHHVADGKKSGRTEDLYFAFLVGNMGEKPVRIDILNGASYVSQPDAPFISLEPFLDNDAGNIFAGPGDRVTNELLRGEKTPEWKGKVTVPPGKTVLLKSLPLKVMFATPHANGRSVIARLNSNGPVHMALVSKYAILTGDGSYREPLEEEYLAVLEKGELVHPRDVAPTRPEEKGPLKYGRVSGVASGTTWKARVTDKRSPVLDLPEPGKPIAYVISALKQGTFGTGQVQSAPLVVRYEDTAYQAHGNYGIHYDLTFPLKNTTDRDLRFNFIFETPMKSDQKKDSVTFYDPSYPNTFFRGTIKVSTGSGKKTTHYKHLVEHRAESSTPLFSEVLAKGETRIVRVELLYPPDCTPPQILTLSTSTDVE